jgi:hypothetical protein
LLIGHHVVKLGVIEQETALRRNAGDIPIAVLPADIVPGIDVPGVQLLRRTVIETADVEHQHGIALLKLGGRRPI